jgi:uncharacterized protein (DUF302 family)
MEKLKKYAFSAVLETSYEGAVAMVTDALKGGGGVLTEIDVKATLKKKLDVDFRRYVILGACNPPYAHRALLADLDVGLLLPCNVIVYEAGDEKTHVSAINPVSALGVIESEELRKIAEEVSEKLKRVIEEVAKKKSV